MYECIETSTHRYTRRSTSSRVGTYPDENSAFDAANYKYLDLILCGINPEFSYIDLPSNTVATLSWSNNTYDIAQVYKKA